MTSLFSTFEPSSSQWFSLNWLSAMLYLMFFPSIYWVTPSQVITFVKISMVKIFVEFNSNWKKYISSSSNFVYLVLISYIVMNNFLGLLPYVFTSSSHLTFTLTLALPLWLGNVLMSWILMVEDMLAHLVPSGTPMFLIPLMVFIEILSTLMRPLTLSVRLAANMMAGHLLLTLISGPMVSNSYIFLVLIFSGLLFLMLLEIAVSLIQGYVFSLLSVLYIQEVDKISIYMN